RALPEPSRRRSLRLRPALAAAVALAIALGLGAALISGLRGSPSNKRAVVAGAALPATPGRALPPQYRAGYLRPPVGKFARPPFSASLRLQDYRATMRLRVDDLSRATKTAVRTTRRLGGYV